MDRRAIGSDIRILKLGGLRSFRPSLLRYFARSKQPCTRKKEEEGISE